MSPQRIAIVYDWIDKWGGVERLLLTLHEMYPDADWFTSYYDREGAKWFDEILRFAQDDKTKKRIDSDIPGKLRTSFIQQFPNFVKKNRILSLPFYPYAFESFDFSGYKMVISVTSSFAKGVITHPEAKHICYLLTPTRYIWGLSEQYLSGWKKIVSTKAIEELRQWDFMAAQRPDILISLSASVAERCKKYYQRESKVIYPPFDLDYWENVELRMSNYELGISNDIKTRQILRSAHGGNKDYYLIVSRLEPYKKIDLVINTFNMLKDKKLIIVGKGTQKKMLKQLSGSNCTFIEDVTDEELAVLYSQAKALIMPQEEDFGYVSLEAQFFFCPVIAYRKGGARETVVENQTGIFFKKQTEESLQAALARFEAVEYNLIQTLEQSKEKHLMKFGKDEFKKRWQRMVNHINNL